MKEKEEKNTTSTMTYPSKGTLNRILFKIPLFWWRTGLGPVMSHPALGGSKMLALTTWGRKSRLPRHTMLSYTNFNGRPYVTSGWGEQSDWYKNILANPAVTVQVEHDTFSARGRRVVEEKEFAGAAKNLFDSGGDSHFGPWLDSLGIKMDLNDMLAKRDRVYLLTFDPAEVDAPPPLKADLTWVWGFLLLLPMAIWLWRQVTDKQTRK